MTKLYNDAMKSIVKKETKFQFPGWALIILGIVTIIVGIWQKIITVRIIGFILFIIGFLLLLLGKFAVNWFRK